jgi:hypothetical protein
LQIQFFATTEKPDKKVMLGQKAGLTLSKLFQAGKLQVHEAQPQVYPVQQPIPEWERIGASVLTIAHQHPTFFVAHSL